MKKRTFLKTGFLGLLGWWPPTGKRLPSVERTIPANGESSQPPPMKIAFVVFNVITAGGVSSSLDLGLFLCEKWAGKEAREEIRQRMDYRCYSG